ncbi:MAG: response regulator transcription factor [Gammaproteobacteria bacterium]|nr:response regulator transcription factor [Gammaproteobacteria bacterium]
MRVLIIEDDDATAAYIRKGLREAGHAADTAADGEAGLARAAGGNYQALVVDRMLPRLDGLALIAKLRARGDNTPALILSALGEVGDRVEGLRAGGDDYLAKPFAFAELLARLDALARRARDGAQMGADGGAILRVGDLEMDLPRREVRRGGARIALQPREFRLLEYMMRHSNQVVTRTMLLENVWDYRFDPQTNVIDVHISRLRRKIDRGFGAQLLNTVRGAGYILREPESGPDAR